MLKRRLAMSEPTLWGIHASKLGEAHALFLAFDSRHKGILPLKRIFVPESLIAQE
jgi:hypothetical protein